MKILLTTDPVGGVWDYATRLYRRLTERGHDVLLASLGRPATDRLSTLPSGANWVYRPFALEWDEAGLGDLEAAAGWIAELSDRMEADVVHLNQMAYAHRIERPTLVVVHSDAWSWFSRVRGAPPTSDPRWCQYRRAVARGLAAADLVVAPSRYQAELTTHHYGRVVDQIVLNGIDREHFPGEPRLLRTPGRGPTSLVTVGRAWDEAKGHRVVDEALALVSEPWTAYLAGDTDGPDGQCFRPRRLKHLGRLPLRGVRQLLGRSSLYVGPSIYEPFGLAPVEAAMAGCALVLSDIGSFRELWGGDALYFPPGDAAALAEILDRLRADDALHHDLRLRAMRRAWSRFDDRQMTARYVGMYERLIRRRARMLAGRSGVAAPRARRAERLGKLERAEWSATR